MYIFIYTYWRYIYIADTRRTDVISGFLPITRERSRRCTDYGERASEGRKKAAAKEWRREDRGPWDRARSGESERGRRYRATTKEGDTTEETFQMCYRLLNKFRVKLPDLVSTAVAPAGRKWRIKAANLPVFIRLLVAPRVAAPLLFPRRFRALARKECVYAFVG